MYTEALFDFGLVAETLLYFGLVVVGDVLENSKLAHIPSVDEKVELARAARRCNVVRPHVVTVPEDGNAEVAGDDRADDLVRSPKVDRVPLCA